ncbi:MAG TPA: hypothetical protein VFS05_08110, partial [Gemmatimonadaceae bacterium]|nr:hypothetical protein [Gemmatimonadaceae bacterium]
PARAQDVRCTDPGRGVIGTSPTGQPQGGDACQKGVDLFNYLTPQLGSLIAGGNALVGRGAGLGGLGHFAVAVRANVLWSDIPDVSSAPTPTAGAPVSSRFATVRRAVALPQIEAAMGLYAGLPLGLGRVGSVDALGSVFYLPDVSADHVDITTSSAQLRFGYGVRVGILGESAMLPSLSVSWMRRHLPTTSVVANPAAIDTVRLTDFRNRATAWRVVAGKGFGPLALSAGYGRDSYSSRARVDFAIYDGCLAGLSCPVRPRAPFEYASGSSGSTVFADAVLTLPLLQLVAELGQNRSSVKAGDLFNTFDQPPDRARLFGAVAVRVSR